MMMRNIFSSVVARRKLLCAGLIAALTGGAVVARAWQDGTEPSSLAEAARKQTAKERELATLLRARPDIESATVNYDERTAPNSRETQRVASIFLRSENARPVKKSTLNTVADLAAQHFNGLARQNISVFDQGSQQNFAVARTPGAQASEVAQYFNVQQSSAGQSRNSQIPPTSNYTTRATGFYQSPRMPAYTVSRPHTEQDAKIRELLERVKRADEDDKAALKEELTALLSQQFDQRHTAQEKRLEALKASVDEAQAAIKMRAENRDKIVERRAKELLGEPDATDWDYNLEARFPSSASPTRYYSPRFPTATIPSPVRPAAPASPGYSQQTAPQYAPRTSRAPVATQQIPATQLPGIRSNSSSWIPGQQDSIRVLQSQVETSAAALKDIERLHKMGAISAGELRKAQGSLIEAEARLKATQETLETLLQSAKIDMEAEHADLQLLREQMVEMKTGTAESFDVKRSMTRAEANIRKSELELNRLSKQLSELKALEEAAKKSIDAVAESAKETEL